MSAPRRRVGVLARKDGEVRLIEIGLDAVLVEVEAAHTLQLADAARRAGWACDVVPGAQSVLLDGVRDRPGALAWLSAWQPQDREAGTELVEIAVRYDGPDLAAVATAWGCRPEQVAERHAAILWEAAFAGFAPGFAYLRPAGGELALPEVPRRRSPRPRVEPGSVAVASAWTGIYPTASPGGWQLIGSTDAVLWSLERPAPSLLPPGTRVRFVVR